MESEIRLTSQNNHEKERVGDTTLPDFSTYYKAMVIKIVCYWHEYRHTNQWNRIESTEVNPYIYGHLILDKGTKSIQ